MVLKIIACFFSNIDRYSYGQKAHTSQFFFFLWSNDCYNLFYISYYYQKVGIKLKKEKFIN